VLVDNRFLRFVLSGELFFAEDRFSNALLQFFERFIIAQIAGELIVEHRQFFPCEWEALLHYNGFDVDRKLLVMRPYQIVAAERILQRIETSTNYKQLGSLAAGGYVWHTTGSGKTLTSFKAAQLASALPSVAKVLFIVDRKDLDYQTMREYDRFQKGAANSNKSTAVLKRQLEDPNARIIITTIQKLTRFVEQNKAHPIYADHVTVLGKVTGVFRSLA